MQILFEAQSLDQIEKYKDIIPCFKVGFTSLTSFSASSFSFEDLSKASKLSNIYVDLNMMMHIDDKEEVIDNVNQLSKLDIHYIVQDLGIALILKDMGLINKTIFNPYTLITNSEDAKNYLEIGFESVVLSSEITINDMTSISKNNNVSATIFGYYPMYQTYRHVVNLYKQYGNLDFSNDNLYLKEFTRNYKAHIIDNKYGSVIFRHYIISLIKEFDKLDSVNLLIVNTIFLNDDDVDYLINILYQLMNQKIDKDIAHNLLSNRFNIDDGFIYKDSIYDPKEF